MTDQAKLKPCPFCGAKFNISQEPHDNHPVAGMFYIFHEYGPIGSDARKCRLDIRGHFDSEDEATDFWNTRAASTGDELEALREFHKAVQAFDGSGDFSEKIDRVVAAKERLAALGAP